jgi:hypothetical protein
MSLVPKYYGQMSEQQFPPKGFFQTMSLSLLKRVVCQAGGEWVGIQETVPPIPPLLLFNSPTTDSTLAVKLYPEMKIAEVGEAVKKRIADSDKQFERRLK